MVVAVGQCSRIDMPFLRSPPASKARAEIRSNPHIYHWQHTFRVPITLQVAYPPISST
jgi:hypothetical protein